MFDFVFMSAAVDIDVYGWHLHKHSDLFEAQYNLIIVLKLPVTLLLRNHFVPARSRKILVISEM